MSQVFFAALFLGTPAALVWLSRTVPLAAKIGPIVLCYAAGLLVGLSGLLPEGADGIRKSVTEPSVNTQSQPSLRA